MDGSRSLAVQLVAVWTGTTGRVRCRWEAIMTAAGLELQEVEEFIWVR